MDNWQWHHDDDVNLSNDNVIRKDNSARTHNVWTGLSYLPGRKFESLPCTKINQNYLQYALGSAPTIPRRDPCEVVSKSDSGRIYSKDSLNSLTRRTNDENKINPMKIVPGSSLSQRRHEESMVSTVQSDNRKNKSLGDLSAPRSEDVSRTGDGCTFQTGNKSKSLSPRNEPRKRKTPQRKAASSVLDIDRRSNGTEKGRSKQNKKLTVSKMEQKTEAIKTPSSSNYCIDLCSEEDSSDEPERFLNSPLKLSSSGEVTSHHKSSEFSSNSKNEFVNLIYNSLGRFPPESPVRKKFGHPSPPVPITAIISGGIDPLESPLIFLNKGDTERSALCIKNYKETLQLRILGSINDDPISRLQSKHLEAQEIPFSFVEMVT